MRGTRTGRRSGRRSRPSVAATLRGADDPGPLDDLFPLLAPGVPGLGYGQLAAVSFRPTRAGEADTIEVRLRTLTVGGVLPELPLALDAGRVVMVDLEATYEDARGRSRL